MEKCPVFQSSLLYSTTGGKAVHRTSATPVDLLLNTDGLLIMMSLKCLKKLSSLIFLKKEEETAVFEVPEEKGLGKLWRISM